MDGHVWGGKYMALIARGMLALLVLWVPMMTLATERVEGASTELGIITGGEQGTYFQFGLDIQKLLRQVASPLSLNVYASKGSVENIYAVYQRPATQMGIVQSDVLAFV